MLSSMATRSLLAELLAAFSRETSHAVQLSSAGGVDVAQRVQGGEAVDVVVLASNAIEKLVSEGHLLSDSRVDVARSGMGIAVGSGQVRPDVGSQQAVRDAVLAAPSVGYSTGPSGKYLLSLFERWGLMQQIAQRIVQAPPGVPVATLVARGEVALGFQQLSELLGVPGIDVLGPLPADIQHITLFSAAVPRTCSRADDARALLAFLAAPAAADIKRRHGMEPA
ncbi:MAG: substrate-binding domain-containing protein [Burkholderiaceae bacterium]